MANIRIHDGKIKDIGPFKPAANQSLLDVKGLIVAPGFIEFQTLSPAAIEKDPAAAALLSQGVTTAVLGADGSGPYSVEEFMVPFDEETTGGEHRRACRPCPDPPPDQRPDYKRPAMPDEVGRMGELISDAMKQERSAWRPICSRNRRRSAHADELLSLAKVVAKFGGTILLTPRDAKSAVALARDAKTPVQVITKDKALVAEIEPARVQRIDISADSYPTHTGSRQDVSSNAAYPE